MMIEFASNEWGIRQVSGQEAHRISIHPVQTYEPILFSEEPKLVGESFEIEVEE